jgi:hypothetical protein
LTNILNAQYNVPNASIYTAEFVDLAAYLWRIFAANFARIFAPPLSRHRFQTQGNGEPLPEVILQQFAIQDSKLGMTKGCLNKQTGGLFCQKAVQISFCFSERLRKLSRFRFVFQKDVQISFCFSDSKFRKPFRFLFVFQKAVHISFLFSESRRDFLLLGY